MSMTNTIGTCGLVLDVEVRSRKSGSATDQRLSSPNEDSGVTGHFILNRYRVDDDGHVCLSPSLPLSELRGSIEILTAQLESLLQQAEQRFAEITRAH